MSAPKKNTAFTFTACLVDSGARPALKANPTLASGDVKVSIDGGAFANLTTLPTVSPAGGRAVQVALTAGEMNGDRIDVQFVDAAGAEWDDVTYSIQTSVNTTDDLSARIPAALGGNGNMKADVRDYSGVAGTFAAGRAEVNTTHLAGAAVNTAAAQIGVNVVSAAGTAWGSGAITAASIAADAITAAKIADGAIDSATFAAGTTLPRCTLVDTITTYTGNTPQTGDAFVRLGAPAGASVSADVAAVKSDSAAILGQTGTTGVVVAAGSKTGYALTSGEHNSIADAFLDRADGVEAGLTPRQGLRLIVAAEAGKVSGGGTSTITIRNYGDTLNRLVATCDADGNRSAVTVNLG